jgi:hypothetical protein
VPLLVRAGGDPGGLLEWTIRQQESTLSNPLIAGFTGVCGMLLESPAAEEGGTPFIISKRLTSDG